jgi:spore coat protein A, manganese oxidase
MGLLSVWHWNSDVCHHLADAVPRMVGLADPAEQKIFVQDAPNALDPAYIMAPRSGSTGAYQIGMGMSLNHTTGIEKDGVQVKTTIFGYSENNQGLYLWPGKTIVQTVKSAGGLSHVEVEWINNLSTLHILPVDTNLHWCFSLPDYTRYSIAKDGIPVVPHLHGGRTDFQFVSAFVSDRTVIDSVNSCPLRFFVQDGNPEFFFTPGAAVVGPQWANVSGGFTNNFKYNNDIRAEMLWL